MIGSNLLRYRTDQLYMGLDMESEGLSMAYSRPWQVAWAIADSKSIIRTKVAYPWWSNLKVSREAALVTRFDYDQYKAQARDAREVLAEFEADLMSPNHRIVWQNGSGADFYFHQTWRRELGLPYDDSYLIRSIDLKGLTQALKKGWTPDISSPAAFLSWQYKATSYIEKGLKSSLSICAVEEGIEHDLDTLHDATSDIILMMKLYWKRLYQLEF